MQKRRRCRLCKSIPKAHSQQSTGPISPSLSLKSKVSAGSSSFPAVRNHQCLSNSTWCTFFLAQRYHSPEFLWTLWLPANSHFWKRMTRTKTEKEQEAIHKSSTSLFMPEKRKQQSWACTSLMSSSSHILCVFCHQVSWIKMVCTLRIRRCMGSWNWTPSEIMVWLLLSHQTGCSWHRWSNHTIMSKIWISQAQTLKTALVSTSTALHTQESSTFKPKYRNGLKRPVSAIVHMKPWPPWTNRAIYHWQRALSTTFWIWTKVQKMRRSFKE